MSLPSIENLARDVAEFDPRKTRKRDALADAGIEYAKAVKDWPLLARAVDVKIEEQRKFVCWWDDNVQPVGRPKNNPDRHYLSVEKAEGDTGIPQPTESKWKKRLKDIPGYRVRLYGPSYKAAMGALADAQLVQQSLSNEHYTPAIYIEAARAVLGSIDLDPASSATANETVKATQFFEASQDGLLQDWHGHVWINPPYGDLVGKFIGKLVRELAANRVTAAIALVNAHCTDTAWFQPLWDGCLCFTDHRINFTGDDTRSGSTHGSVFAYFGPKEELFAAKFDKFGACVVQI